MAKLEKPHWHAVTPLLEELLDATATEQAARLAQIDGQDRALAAELASLLALHAQVETEGFLEGNALDRLGSASTLAGKTLGNYTLEREIGAGGMSTVWLAQRADGRYEGRAAVKFLNLGVLGRGGTQRFRREGNALARLAHPNIAHLLDAGDLDGHPYLVIEFVDGQPIDAWCDSRKLGVVARVELFMNVLSAVAYAHSQLVLHRDLKPSNILVNSAGVVKLLDFGIAKLLVDDKTDEPTQATSRALTPAYAAPEQVLGGPMSTATDVYALGVLLYVLLTGRHPTLVAGSTPVDHMRALTEGEPVRMSEAVLQAGPEVARVRDSTPQQLARALRGDLENIVARALKKSPAERYPSVDALADDLRRLLRDEPVSARADSVAYRVTKFVRRYRFAVIGVSVSVVALIAASAVAVWQMLEAQRRGAQAEEHAARAVSSAEFLQFVLGETGASGRPFTTQDLLARAENSIEGHYGSLDHPRAIEQLIQLSEMYGTVAQGAKALELAQTARRNALKAGHAELARLAACSLGKQLHMAGQLKEAATLLDQTIGELRAMPGERLALADCVLFRADLALTLGDVDSGVPLAKEAVALVSAREFKDSPAQQIAPRMQLAIAYRVAGQNANADAEYRDLHDLLKRLGRERTTDAINASSNWGKLRSDVGDILGAIRLIEQALAAGQALRPGGSPDYVTALNYAQRLLTLHHLDDAQRFFLEARDGAAAENDPEMQGKAMLGVAAVERERGDLAPARSALQAASELLRRNFPAPEFPARRTALIESGRLYLAAGSLAAAKAELSEAAAKNEATKTKSPDAVMTLAELAQTEHALGHRERAAALALQAGDAAAGLALPGEPSYWVGYCLLVRSGIERAAGHADAARELASQSLAQLSPTVGADHPHAQRAQQLARD